MTIESIRLWLLEQDPDDVVDMLRLSTEELLEAFPDKVHEFHLRGDVDVDVNEDDLSGY